MSPFHSEMNHWQRQWLSDRLHKKHQDQLIAETIPPIVGNQPKPARKVPLKKKSDQKSST